MITVFKKSSWFLCQQRCARISITLWWYVLKGFAAIKKWRKHMGKVNGRTWWQGDWQKPFWGKNCKGFNIHISHPLIHLPLPPTLIPQNGIHPIHWRNGNIKCRRVVRWSLQNFPLLFSHSPLYPEPGISKTPKVLTLFSHWLSLTIVGGDSREVCMNFSKPFFWFKQKAKEVMESVWCTKHRLWFS